VFPVQEAGQVDLHLPRVRRLNTRMRKVSKVDLEKNGRK
jgi:hypothetical protein